MTKLKCYICKKNSEVTNGWHITSKLNFCSNNCVAKYLQRVCDNPLINEVAI